MASAESRQKNELERCLRPNDVRIVFRVVSREPGSCIGFWQRSMSVLKSHWTRGSRDKKRRRFSNLTAEDSRFGVVETLPRFGRGASRVHVHSAFSFAELRLEVVVGQAEARLQFVECACPQRKSAVFARVSISAGYIVSDSDIVRVRCVLETPL